VLHSNLFPEFPCDSELIPVEALTTEQFCVFWCSGCGADFLYTPDCDWVIRDAKFRKSRLVPLHVSSLKVLSDYAPRRNHLFASGDSGYFFPSRRGARPDEGQVRRTFYRLSRQIGIRGAVASRGPRLHEFRNRLAVETLLHWHRGGRDVRRHLPVLCTYLGQRPCH
jgi:integrase/recombinase XerD